MSYSDKSSYVLHIQVFSSAPKLILYNYSLAYIAILTPDISYICIAISPALFTIRVEHIMLE